MSNLLISYHATSEAKGGCPFTSASPPPSTQGGRTVCRSADPPYPGSTLRLGPHLLTGFYPAQPSRRENLGKGPRRDKTSSQACCGDEKDVSPHTLCRLAAATVRV